MQRLQRGLFITVAVLLAGPTACETADPSKPEYWITQLESGARQAAVRQLGKMKDPLAVEPLMKAYKEGRYKDDIVASLAKIGDKKAMPVMLAALEDYEEQEAAKLAASTILEWGVPDNAGEALVKIVSNARAPKHNRYAALQILAEKPSAKAKASLIKILKEDPDVQPIALNGLAAEALGKLKAGAATDGLIRCLWLDDALGRNEVPKCRLALNRVGGKAAIPALIATMERKNRAVEKRARKNKFSTGGLIEAKCAELLGDMPDPRAVEPLLKALTMVEEMPPSVANNPDRSRAFVMANVQRVISTSRALAVIGDERAINPLLELAGSKDRALEYKLAAVQQLAFLGQAGALKGILKLMKKDPHPLDPVSQGFRVQLALAAANLVKGTDTRNIKAIEKQMGKIKKVVGKWVNDAKGRLAKADKPRHKTQIKQDIRGYSDQLKNYGEVDLKLAAIKECKEDVQCWATKLGDKQVPVRLVAAYRLAQMKGEARKGARDALAKFAGDKDLVVRNVILFGLGRTVDSSIIPAIERARKEDAARAEKDKRYKGGVYTLDLMLATLGNR